jgi:glutamate racemase
VTVIDPSPAIARRVKSLLNDLDLINRDSSKIEITFCTTGEVERFKQIIYSLIGIETSPISLTWKSNNLIQVD